MGVYASVLVCIDLWTRLNYIIFDVVILNHIEFTPIAIAHMGQSPAFPQTAAGVLQTTAAFRKSLLQSVQVQRGDF